MDIRQMEEYKYGKIHVSQALVGSECGIRNVLRIDPAASMLVPSRPVYWLNMKSFLDALGTSRVLALRQRSFAAMTIVAKVLSVVRSRKARSAWIMYIDKGKRKRDAISLRRLSFQTYSMEGMEKPGNRFFAKRVCHNSGWAPGMMGMPSMTW